MVLIERPTESSQPSPETAVTSASAAPLLDSFENIDALLEGQSEPTKTTLSSRRWRSGEEEPADETFAGERLADDTTEPIRADRTTATSANESMEMESVDSADEPVPESFHPTTPADWLSTKTLPLRGYLMVGVGALAGITLATGLAVWFIRGALTSSPSSTDIASGTVAMASAEDVPDDEPNATLDDEPNRAINDQKASDSRPITERLPDTSALSVSPSPTPPSADSPVSDAPRPLGNAVANEASASVSQQTESGDATDTNPLLPPVDDPTPTGEPEDQATGETQGNDEADANDMAGGSPDTFEPTGDDLANFASWLQNPAVATPPTDDRAGDQLKDPNTVSESHTEDRVGRDSTTDSRTSQQPLSEPTIVPSKNPPAPINVESRLKQRISAVSFKKVPIVTAVRLLTDLTTVPISINPSALERRNLASSVTVSFTKTQANLEQVLDQMTSELGLAYRVLPGQVEITTRPDAKDQLVTVKHEVADLVRGDSEQVEALSNWVRDLIAPGTWRSEVDSSNDAEADGGRRGSCDVEGTRLVVTHSDAVQFDVLALLEKLRRARQIELRADVTSGRTQLGNRAARLKAADTRVRVRAATEMGISDLAAAIEKQTDVQILVDWVALYAAGWTPEDRHRLFIDGQTVVDALATFLHARGLAFRVIDEDTIEITTAEQRHTVHDLEVYRLPSSVNIAAVKRFSEQLVERLGPLKFAPQGQGAIAYDPIGNALITLLPQPDQGRVHNLIESFAWDAEGNE